MNILVVNIKTHKTLFSNMEYTELLKEKRKSKQNEK